MSAHKHTPGPWHSTGRYVGSGHAKMNICECSDNSGCWSNAPEAVANARLIAAAKDHALICWAMCVGAARWEPWGDRRGEFCMNGLRHATELDEFGCPVVTGGMRSAILQAMGEPA